MRWPHRFVSVWWLTLLVVSCLLARPLHEALDLVQAGKGRAARAMASASSKAMGPGDVLHPSLGVAQVDAQDDAQGSERLAQAEPLTTADRGSSDSADNLGGPDSPDSDESKPGACAWCLMLAGQAQAPAGVPVMLIQHAEASPPPLTLESGLPAGRCLLAAAPRGPPQA